MQGSVSCGEIKPEGGYKIYFPERVFGKPTKNRQEDPSMFQLLAWGSDGFERHAFKKDQKFKQPAEAYLNMIGKSPWTSECQQNYVSYCGNCVEANLDVLGKIQNYIGQRSPQSSKLQKKSPQKVKKSEKRIVLPDQKKENKYNPVNYMSPKAERKVVEYGSESQKAFVRSSSGDNKKSAQKVKATEEQKFDKYESHHKKMMNKSYGQNLEKSKLEQHQFTQGEQHKLIEKFKQTTRWIPNSAFTTYFGKPPFENYGRGNTHPIDGGLIYGTYLYSHNVHPHRGKNQPKSIQCYPVALQKAKSQGTLIPSYPRTKAEFSTSMTKAEMSQTGKIEPEINNFVGSLSIETPKLQEMEKFGGKRKSRVTTDYPTH